MICRIISVKRQNLKSMNEYSRKPLIAFRVFKILEYIVHIYGSCLLSDAGRTTPLVFFFELNLLQNREISLSIPK